jgi:glycosyltransferase involved in cell wall biosynthesis
MRFSIISPTLQRESLVACCESVNSQSHRNWQHLVIADVEALDLDLMARIRHPQRIILKCPYPHRNWANTCRHNAWEYANGDYVVHLDDDNTLADPHILRDMDDALDFCAPAFAVFPILRHASIFYSHPPRICHVDTGNLVLRRDIGRWPDIPDATSDGILAERLHAQYGSLGFRLFRPIIIMPKSNVGKGVREGEGTE